MLVPTKERICLLTLGAIYPVTISGDGTCYNFAIGPNDNTMSLYIPYPYYCIVVSGCNEAYIRQISATAQPFLFICRFMLTTIVKEELGGSPAVAVDSMTCPKLRWLMSSLHSNTARGSTTGKLTT
jgi:hypothetical protein